MESSHMINCMPFHTVTHAFLVAAYPEHRVSPSHPIQHPTAGESTPMTPMGLVMAGCWLINSILTIIGRRNPIRILDQ